MNDEYILEKLLNISQAIANDEDKFKILKEIAVLTQKIENKRDKAAEYIDGLVDDLK